MDNADKTREELLTELSQLRERNSALTERLELLESAESAEESLAATLEEDLHLASLLSEAESDGASAREIARILTVEIQRVFNTRSVNLYVISDDGSHLEMQNIGLAPGIMSAAERVLGFKIPLIRVPKTPESTLWKTIEERKTRVWRSREEVARLLFEFAAWAPEATSRLPGKASTIIEQTIKILAFECTVHIPLYSRGLAVGLLAVAAREQIPDRHIPRLESIAQHVAAILATARIEQDWRRERELAAAYLNAAPGFLLVLDTQGCVEAISQDGCEILGLPEHEIVGRDWAESFVPERVRQSAVRRISEVLGGGADKIFNGHALTARGDERVVRWRTSGLRDSDGKVTSLLATGVDLTRVKQSEEREARSRRRYRALVENSTDLTFILSADGVFTHVSPSGAAAMGFVPDELIDTQAMKLIHPEDVELFGKAMRIATTIPGPSPNYSMRLIAKDGSVKVLEGVANMQLDNPDIQGVILNLRDVTERERMEGSIEHSAARFRALIDSSHELMLVLGADLTIKYASPSCSRDLGYTRDALAGLSFEELVHGGDMDREVFLPRRPPGETTTKRMHLRTEDRRWICYDATITNRLHDPAIEGFIINALRCEKDPDPIGSD